VYLDCLIEHGAGVLAFAGRCVGPGKRIWVGTVNLDGTGLNTRLYQKPPSAKMSLVANELGGIGITGYSGCVFQNLNSSLGLDWHVDVSLELLGAFNDAQETWDKKIVLAGKACFASGPSQSLGDNCYIVKLNPELGSGTIVYSDISLTCESEVATCVAVDRWGGDYIVAGNIESPDGNSDVFVRRVEEPHHYVCGDVNGDGVVSISDVVAMVNYIFSGGAEPRPLGAGDADCNGSISVSDAVYMINWIYAGGQAPCARCQ
jgi:hypothetical protein